MRLVLVLVVLLVCATGLTYAQGLQNMLTQPAAGSSILPDVVSTISSQPQEPSVVQVLTETAAQQPPPSSDSPGVIYAHIVDSATQVSNWVAPPQLTPAGGWRDMLSVQQDVNRGLYVMTPEPGSYLVLAFGLSGLIAWRFKSKAAAR